MKSKKIFYFTSRRVFYNTLLCKQLLKCPRQKRFGSLQRIEYASNTRKNALCYLARVGFPSL
jgi:hypothetical protein